MKFIAPIASFLLVLFSPIPALAQTQDWAAKDTRCVISGDVATIQGLECLFFNVLQVIVALAGLAFFFMFISGGFKYLFSRNDQKAVASASSTLTMAIIGLVGIIISWLILQFIGTFTGLDLTNFVIPG